MDWRAVVVLVHVLAAFGYVAGYVGTNLCTELARRTQSDQDRRSALVISGRFDRWLNAPGGAVVSLSGILALWVFGYSLTTLRIVLLSRVENASVLTVIVLMVLRPA